MLLTPGRPGRAIPSIFTSTEATVVYYFGGRRYTIEAVGIVEAHSLVFDDPGLDTSVERMMNFRIRYQISSGGTIQTALNWTALSFGDLELWGNNFFVAFNNPFQCWRLYVDLKPQTGNTSEVWGPSIGAVVAGKAFTFPEPMMAPMGRGLKGGAVVASRPYGPVAVKANEKSTRVWMMRSRVTSEADRLSIERLMANRGRATNWHPMTRPRLDLQTVMATPDLWYSANSETASCAFGRFTGMASQTVIGGGAYVDLVFEETA
jgi:hypothetical protein